MNNTFFDEVKHVQHLFDLADQQQQKKKEKGGLLMVSPQELGTNSLPLKCVVCGYVWVSSQVYGCPECGSYDVVLVKGNPSKEDII